MNLDDIKKQWQEQDEKLEKQLRLNLEILRKVNLDRTQSALSKFLKTPVFGILVSAALLVYLAFFFNQNAENLEFVVPAAIVAVFAAYQLIFSLYQTSTLAQISYSEPVAQIQKSLERLRIYRHRYLITTRLSYPLLWIPVLIVALKGIWGENFYAHFDTWWLIMQICLGLAFISLGLWLAHAAANNRPLPALLQTLSQNIERYDLTGKELSVAAGFLKEIKTFEKEE